MDRKPAGHLGHGRAAERATDGRVGTCRARHRGLDPDTRAAIVEHLDSPRRFERINDWSQLVQDVPATARRPNGRFSRAMTRVLAIEIVWRLAANRELPSFLA